MEEVAIPLIVEVFSNVVFAILVVEVVVVLDVIRQVLLDVWVSR